MPSPRRILRLQRVVLETAATVVQRELSDPRLGFVTITRARLSPDLAEATVYWSCLGSDAERRNSSRALSHATGIVQSAIARALATRTTPTITFRYDPTMTKAQRLEEIFEGLKDEPGHEPEPAADADPAARSTPDTPVGEGDAEAPPPRPWKRKKPRREKR